ncbi:SagB family peptide dehydrogenase [Kitasatospora sp. NPDC088548]|uniref:SagB family peptide dehydrogenase n=1 Tax=Kitasatospora sp. NPDC088548 TaxID=3364075 RepID=UPI003804F67A
MGEATWTGETVPAPDLVGSAGLRFWWRTFEAVQELFAEGHGQEGDEDDPLPAKVFRGLPRHVLSEPARRIGDARWSFPGFLRAHAGGAPRLTALDEPDLSALLQHAYGLVRMELGPHAAWPYHRAVASARCFHPVELYLWLARPAGALPAGCYHYDPAHHALTGLRPGGLPTELRAATGAGGEDTLALVVAAVCFRKSAFRYRDYAYRLCAQEVGMTVGNVLLVGGALGLRARVHHRFDDAVVNRALGLDGVEETAFAVLDLGPARPAATGATPLDGEPTEPAEPRTPLTLAPLPPIRPSHLRTNTVDPAAWSGLAELDRAGRLTGAGAGLAAPVEPAAFHLPADRPRSARPIPTSGEEPPAGGVELARALRARDSGGRMFLPDGAALPAHELACLLRYALEPVASDHTEAACRPLVDCHVLVLNVDGVPAGLYRLDAEPSLEPEPSSEPEPWRGPGPRPDAGPRPVAAPELVPLPGRAWHGVVSMLCDRTPAVNTAKANAVVFLSVDRVQGDRWFGDRGYRILHHEGGIVAQRISVLAAAAGLSARITNGYHDGAVRALIGAGPAQVPVFTLVLGRRRATAQYEPPLTW